ncbi:uncharacterized protein PHALS_04338 [Plasmopara halstedii]|uniref:Uncharacterized protein n=1 Tax=Plasmopara halstedii TaxID=4781 RepID=A0A0P1AZZ8_PLAHL|nr:uncharacterized protein PHALS_04338 [Plasmopara halstedii]CEG47465.1 hypothetical protein PHALS_04338 [Plasmopara halstedii]|eukprot:XP_024583834.1 hypothetical protein PHALS_04338 [Plasmopara halstedii]
MNSWQRMSSLGQVAHLPHDHTGFEDATTLEQSLASPEFYLAIFCRPHGLT